VGQDLVFLDNGSSSSRLYLEEPRKIQPQQITAAVLRAKAFTGVLSLAWTVVQMEENGSPESLHAQLVQV
jgi:hypothetical protein